jgi:valyl-tRNA synthetase
MWNAVRFALGRIESPASEVDMQSMSLADRWMCSRLVAAVEDAEKALAEYRFNHYAEVAYDIIWRDFCDWYLEAIKPTIGDDAQQQRVLLSVLDALLRLLHPICPFVTEAVWPHVRALGDRKLPGLDLPDAELVASAAWPVLSASLIDEDAEQQTDRLQRLVGEVRRARSENDVPVKAKIALLAPPRLEDMAKASAGMLAAMCRVAEVRPRGETLPAGMLAFVFDGEEVLLDLAGGVDPEAERARLESKAEALQGTIKSLNGRLSNDAYVQKAPAHLVDETRSQLQQAEADLVATQAAIEALS